ncbi:MAG: hypothetical protein ABI867_06400 [Kofleriaceae bacterium]
MLVRWIVPVVTLLVLAVQSAAAYANAGVTTEVHCCCPTAAECRCHPDQHRRDSIERCAGSVRIDAPIVAAIVLPEAPVTSAPQIQAPPVEHVVIAIPTVHVIEPEKPPF